MKHRKKELTAIVTLGMVIVVFPGLFIQYPVLAATAADGHGKEKQWALKEAYSLLFQGRYDEAIVEAEKAIEAHEDDHVIVSRGVSVKARALTMAGRSEQAIKYLDSTVRQYEGDNSPYSDNCPVPMSLFMKIQRARDQVFLYQRLENYQQAAKATGELIVEERKALTYYGTEQRKEKEFIVEVLIVAGEGDIYRFDKQYAKAVTKYETALEFLTKNMVTTQAVVDKNAPPQHPARPTSKMFETRLPWLIERCKNGGSEAIKVEYARNVDFVKDIGDWHRHLGRMYRSKSDYAVALRKYRQCLAYLQQRELPEELDTSTKATYTKLRDTKLPRLISVIDEAD